LAGVGVHGELAAFWARGEEGGDCSGEKGRERFEDVVKKKRRDVCG
jgi:hypothetical protein